MASLFTYARQVQRFIADAKCEMVDPQDIFDNINKARREIAMRSQCLRYITPVSGSVQTIQVTAGGSGYSAPVVTISPPDFPSSLGAYPNGAQATAVAIVAAGVITAISVTFGGAGYFQPIVTITDPSGSGAAATASLSLINTTQGGAEVYPFSGVDLSPFPGIDSILAVESVSILYANYRYSLPVYSFSVYQSNIRQYAFQYQYVPTMAAQLGQGTEGSLYLYPLASTAYQQEWVFHGIPQDLISDQSVEAIPQPWTDAVPHFAAYLTFLEMQNMNSARLHKQIFDEFSLRYSAYSRPGRRVNPYGRY